MLKRPLFSETYARYRPSPEMRAHCTSPLELIRTIAGLWKAQFATPRVDVLKYPSPTAVNKASADTAIQRPLLDFADRGFKAPVFLLSESLVKRARSARRSAAD